MTSEMPITDGEIASKLCDSQRYQILEDQSTGVNNVERADVVVATSDGCATFDSLPVELQYKIFSYLGPLDLISSAALVCRRWWQLAMDPISWRTLTIYRTCCDLPRRTKCLFSRTTLLSSLSFVLANSEDLTHVIGHLVLYSLPLKSLDFSGCKGLTAAHVANLAEFCPSVQELNFEGCDSVDDFFLMAASRWTYLKKINLMNCQKITDYGILRIAACCERLEFLDICYNTRITDISVKTLASNRSSTLLELCLDGANLTDDSFVDVAKCRLLRTLRIPYAEQMTERGLLSLTALRNLKRLEITQAKFLYSECLVQFFSSDHLSNLMSLSLAGCLHLTDEAVELMAAGCPCLRYLNLSWCWDVSEIGVATIVNSFRQMQCLNLTGLVSITGVCFLQIPRQMPYLKCLDLQCCNEIIDDLIEKVVLMQPSLQIVDYYGNAITSESCGQRDDQT